MLPVATLPAAAFLRRFGAIDYVKDFHFSQSIGGFINHYIAPFLLAGGSAIFDHLGLIFAVGIAIGLAGDGIAALAAALAYEVLDTVLVQIPTVFSSSHEKLDMGVMGGITAGLVASYMYKKYHQIKLPEWLGFFSGKRFVSIMTPIVMIPIAILLGFIWGPIQSVLDDFGRWMVELDAFGALIYGTSNRLLLPFGLHHVINNIAWFQIGMFEDSGGREIYGDLARFFAGDPSAGLFMTGYYPIMMFALPAGALAIIRSANPRKRKAISTVFISAALASFFTGITEPVEFAFLFASPVLYIVHALLTGISGFITAILGIKDGFGFSAGFIDFLINYQLATKPLLLIPIGIVFGIVYYALFRYMIVKFNLATPGREEEEAESGPVTSETKPTIMLQAQQVLNSLGGTDNVVSIDACITRLRLVLRNDNLTNDKQLKELGAAGVMRLGQGAVQIIFGTQSERLKDEIKKFM